MVKRVIRLLCIDLYFLSIFGLYRLIVQGGYSPGQCVPVPEWYDDTVDFRNSVVYRMKELKRDMDTTCESVLSYASSRLVGFGPSNPTVQHSQGTFIGRRLNRVREGGKRFTKQWAGLVLMCLLLLFFWLVDHYIIHLF